MHGSWSAVRPQLAVKEGQQLVRVAQRESNFHTAPNKQLATFGNLQVQLTGGALAFCEYFSDYKAPHHSWWPRRDTFEHLPPPPPPPPLPCGFRMSEYSMSLSQIARPGLSIFRSFRSSRSVLRELFAILLKAVKLRDRGGMHSLRSRLKPHKKGPT